MYNKSFAIGFAAMALAGAFGLAMIGQPMQCRTTVWRRLEGAEAAGTATGMTYRDFQQSHCKGGAEPAAAPARLHSAPPRQPRPLRPPRLRRR